MNKADVNMENSDAKKYEQAKDGVFHNLETHPTTFTSGSLLSAHFNWR